MSSAKASSPSVRAILFDLDGTLIDTIDLIAASFDYAVRTVLGKNLPRRKLIANIGRPLMEQARVFSEAKAQEIFDAYNKHNLPAHDSGVKPYPGVSAMLAKLREKGLPLVVVTSKKGELARRGLALCNLDQFVDDLITVEDTARHKPDPEPVREALRRLGLKPAEALFVGDSPYDIISGNEAGVATVAATWGPFPKDDLLKQKPSFVVGAPAEVLDLPVRWPKP